MFQQKYSIRSKTFSCLSITVKQNNKYNNNKLLKIVHIYGCVKCHVVLLCAVAHSLCSPSHCFGVSYYWLK